MFVTEEEAKTKWCPHANVYSSYQNTGACGNRALEFNDLRPNWKHANCLGSGCMMWTPALSTKGGEVWRYLTEKDRDDTIRLNPNDGLIKGGVCGLALGRMSP